MKKADTVLHLSKAQKVELDRQMRYINFVSRQGFLSTPSCDGVCALFDATALLLNVQYTHEQLHSMLDNIHDNSSQAVFVRRYYDFLVSLLADDTDENFDESRIVEFYQQLFELSGSDSKQSAYRAPDFVLMRRGAVERMFYTTSSELSEWVEWLLVRSEEVYLLDDIAIFLYHFVRESTFRQGREELMHLLMLLLLRRAGCRWISMCAPAIIMAENRVDYRRALYGNNEAGDGLTNWVVYFVKVVYEAARRFSAAHAPVLPPTSASHKTALNSRQRAILDYIAKNQPVGLAAIVQSLHKESVNTIKKDLLRMRQLGFIATDGVLKGTVYYAI